LGARRAVRAVPVRAVPFNIGSTTGGSVRIYRILELDGYARIDFRLSPDGRLYFLEANPNPDVVYGGELAESAEAAGLAYSDLLSKIMSLGIARAKRK
jgi:D-alanine-D-alanine ligase